MKFLIFICMAAAFCCHAFTQSYDNNWVFGDSAGLNFSSGPPSPFTSAIITNEAVATISDITGGLLFYSNGVNIWDKNFEIMPNGDSIQIGGGGFSFGSSITQGVIIVQKPLAENLYYIFHIQSIGLGYSVVDICRAPAISVKSPRIIINPYSSK